MKTTLMVVGLIVTLSVPSVIFCQDGIGNVMQLNAMHVIQGSTLEPASTPNRLFLASCSDPVLREYNSFGLNTMTIQSFRSTKGQASGTKVNLSILGGGVLYESFQWGGGLEFGVTISRWLYIGAFASTQFTENVNNSFVGGDLGYNVDFGNFTLRPFVNLGATIGTGLQSGHSSAAFYLGPALAFTYWLMPNFGIGPDLRFMYLPDHDDSYGGYYMGFVIVL